MFQIAGIRPKVVKTARAQLLFGGGTPWPLGRLPAYPDEPPSSRDPLGRGSLQRPRAARREGRVSLSGQRLQALRFFGVCLGARIR